ncbi:alpha/beta hydrolase [Methanobrevibacter sp.]|uniref:alpha/beta hydrolase n=1 Tax=Methanobrevibacter sp. TaxID=66852 RepID=UPI0026DF9696|nr:alpha/beta hydrolase [Methanobrevibacter sp.]MDO5859621.1 alpha/beta hydrolase [Methanobrevibacter sp.]
MNRKLKIILIVIIALLLAYAVFYFTEYHHARPQATDCLNGTENVSVIKVDDGLFLDGPGNETAIIFYPGAKNEYIAYLPMLMDLANRSVDCYVLKVPLNFAILGENEATPIIDSGNYSHYILSGHSLGGLTAASYINHTGKGDGLILFAGYPVEEIEKPVLSIYGSEDGILNFKAYNESKSLMDNLTEIVIEGGNHAQFAYYGHQSGDNVAKISAEDQQRQAVDEILDFINKI